MPLDSKYGQIVQTLTRRILEGEYPRGGFVPSEHELMAEFNVGRNTARRALLALQDSGMIHRSRGQRGTVMEDRIVDRLGETCRVSELLKENRRFSYSRVLDLSVQPIPLRMAERFGLPLDTEVVRVYRLRLADDTAVVLNDAYFLKKEFGFLLDNDLENLSLNAFISRMTGRVVGREERGLEMTVLSAAEAKPLACQTGDPAFLQTQWVWDQNGTPLYFNRSIYHPYLIKFTYNIEH